MADVGGVDDGANEYYEDAFEGGEAISSNENEDFYFNLFEDDDYLTISIPLLCLIALIAAILLFLLRKKTVKGNDILILGLSNSGKTLLFSRLLTNKVIDTYISVKENKSSLLVNKEKPTKVNIVDIPGSDSIRLRIFDQYKSSTKAIIFLLDSSTIQKEIKDAAELLYIVLTDSVIINNQIPILIVCNKQDLGFAKGSTLIKSAVEKELNQLRQTKSAALEGVDGKSLSTNYLGNPKKDFSFSDLKKNPTEFVEFSCKKVNDDSNDVDVIKDWIASV